MYATHDELRDPFQTWCMLQWLGGCSLAAETIFEYRCTVRTHAGAKILCLDGQWVLWMAWYRGNKLAHTKNFTYTNGKCYCVRVRLFAPDGSKTWDKKCREFVYEGDAATFETPQYRAI